MAELNAEYKVWLEPSVLVEYDYYDERPRDEIEDELWSKFRSLVAEVEATGQPFEISFDSEGQRAYALVRTGPRYLTAAPSAQGGLSA